VEFKLFTKEADILQKYGVLYRTNRYTMDREEIFKAPLEERDDSFVFSRVIKRESDDESFYLLEISDIGV